MADKKYNVIISDRAKNPSSQAYAHVFSANFAADCVKNPCRAKARLRILPTLQQNYARKSAHISYEDRF